MKIDSNYPLWWSLEDNMPDPAGWAAVVDLFCATYFGMVIVVILTKLKLF